MSNSYTYSVLRYRPDLITEEFLNIGVVVYSAENSFLKTKCTLKYSRLKRTFEKVDVPLIRFFINHLTSKVEAFNRNLPNIEKATNLKVILAKILTPDDSSLQFSELGAGITDDLDFIVEELFQTFVARHEERKTQTKRNDSKVWSTFRNSLKAQNILSQLTSKNIKTSDFEHQFNYASKNGVWHVCQPLSFDLKDPEKILDKADAWLGKGVLLSESEEQIKLYLLLGEPQEKHLLPTYEKAKKILSRIPAPKVIYQESDAEEFAQDLTKALKEH